ncbi:unnamed protein product [Lactuca saligna]|uniref:AAA ATPase AAA+ lid domain-containing protein n=1 Tax=Lactuca saligna TaxID=75948 RepID=A0AA35YUR2_LACSI|nr:unnamed protein product [Lactuca saligna]
MFQNSRTPGTLVLAVINGSAAQSFCHRLVLMCQESGMTCKQEHIHNSIVSTLLALMDGLDSRGQVILIRAINRIDTIDGELRRLGRFDREFTFQLHGLDARVEILDIHTRKWKQPPIKELKLELATSCVGYCGADMKALCTEAAIHAFCEKYP